MDSDGAFNLSPEERGKMPAYDLAVLKVVRGEWVRLKNEELRNKR